MNTNVLPGTVITFFPPDVFGRVAWDTNALQALIPQLVGMTVPVSYLRDPVYVQEAEVHPEFLGFIIRGRIWQEGDVIAPGVPLRRDRSDTLYALGSDNKPIWSCDWTPIS